MEQITQILFEKTNVHLSQIDEVSIEILNIFPEARIFLLKGEMGAGKTSWVQAFCRTLGTHERAKSPTFSLINEYVSPQGPVYHFDLYRLSGEAEAETLGLEEYFDSGAYCFIEWPEIAPALMPRTGLIFEITTSASEFRNIRISEIDDSLN